MDKDILNLTEKTIDDTSLYSKEFFPFKPITGTDYNSPGVIQINIENQDQYFLPHESFLQIDVSFLKANNTRFAREQMVTLANNGILHCFSNIKYHLGGNEIESVNYPGHATGMMGMLKYDKSFSGLGQCWAPDTTVAAANANLGFKARREFIFNGGNDNIGDFSVHIDLEHIFGFAEDYDKVVYGFRHSLQLNRKANDNDVIFRAGGADNGKIVIKKITWWMPRVQPSVVEGKKLLDINESKTPYDCVFRNRQCSTIALPLAARSYSWSLGVKTETPRYVVIGFQIGKSNNQELNAALFDHCEVTNMKVRVNSTEYPPIDVNSDFVKNCVAGWHRRMLDFKRSFYGVDKMVSCSCVDAKDFKTLYPLYVFDLTRQRETTNNSTISDIAVDMTFGLADGIGAGTNAFAFVISDRKIKIQGDGKRSAIVY